MFVYFRPILVLPPADVRVIYCELSETEKDFYDALFKRSKVLCSQNSIVFYSYFSLKMPYAENVNGSFRSNLINLLNKAKFFIIMLRSWNCFCVFDSVVITHF